MTTLTDTQVITASGGLVELGSTSKNTNQTITNGAAAATVLGPVTFVSDGSPCVVDLYVPRIDAGATTDFYFLLEIDGAAPSGTGQGRIWNWTPSAAENVPCSAQFRFTPTAGSHTATIKAVSVGANATVTCASSNWTPAFLRVSKIVQATQWPAVTTGTIFCTSSTRPAAPFEGQTIYETDTKRSWTRVGAQWVPDDMVFTNEAARDAAIIFPTEGMTAYLTAPTVLAATGATTAIPTGVTTIYNGSVWVCTTPVFANTGSQGTTSAGVYSASLSGSPGTNPSVTLVTGTTALIWMSVEAQGPAANIFLSSLAISGATTQAATDENAIRVRNSSFQDTYARSYIATGLTAGTNTFTYNYRTSAGTATVAFRGLIVQGIA